QPGRFLKILRLDCALFFPANDFDFFFDLLHVGRPGHRINARARAGLVHHINRLVRQKSSGDVALGKFHPSLKPFVGQLGFLLRRISSITALIRSSNWPRYFVPATINARSSVMTFLSRKSSGTLPVAISCASPSTIAVLPTPASPSNTGLFFVRRQST